MAPESTHYLDVDDLIASHDDIVFLTGGLPSGLRDPELLASVAAKPTFAASYENADLVRQAVVLAVGISQAQAFVDGNKRTAMFCADLFLRWNGSGYTGPPLEFASQLEQVAMRTGSLDVAIEAFDAWLRNNVLPMQRRQT